MIALGLALGLVSATLTESFAHRAFGHPGKWQLRFYARFPRLCAPFIRPYYHHWVVHHVKTFRESFTGQFRDEEDKRKVDLWLRRKFPAEFAELVQRERYNLTLIGVSGIVPFVGPFLVGPLLMGVFLGPWSLVGSIPAAFVPALMSKYVHPAIHQPHELTSYPACFQWLMKTRYMKRVSAHHALHHVHTDHNFNLFLGGDWLLGRHYRDSR